MREQGYAEIQAIGASAINQAIKAVTIARGYVEQDEMDLVVVPSFTEVDIDGAERTAVRWLYSSDPALMVPPPTNNGHHRGRGTAAGQGRSAIGFPLFLWSGKP